MGPSGNEPETCGLKAGGNRVSREDRKSGGGYVNTGKHRLEPLEVVDGGGGGLPKLLALTRHLV